MADFTAVIECGFLEFEVEAEIDEDGAFIKTVLWNGKPLLIDQDLDFQAAYGLDELKEEVMTQYDAWVKDEIEDNLIENYLINKLMDR